MKTIQPTSLEAYKNMQPKIPTDQELILSVLSYEKPMTYNEISVEISRKLWTNEGYIAASAWSNPNKVSRRMLELIRLKKVIPGEVRKCTIAKSNCKTYLLNK